MALFRHLSRRAGPVGIAVTAIDLWSRLTPAQRRRVIRMTRKHGPKVAKAAVRHARNRRGPQV